MQFPNPYLGIGNNPVNYIDPDGEFAILPFLKILAKGAGIGGASYTAQKAFGPDGISDWNGNEFLKSAAFGALSGGMAFGIGSLKAGAINSAVLHGGSQGLINELRGGDFVDGFAVGIFSSVVSHSLIQGAGEAGKTALGNMGITGLTGGIVSHANGGNFWQGFGTGVTISGLNHLAHQDPPGVRSLGKGPKFDKNSVSDWMNWLNNGGKRIWVNEQGISVYIDDGGNVIGIAPNSGTPDGIGPPLKKGEKVYNIGKYALSNRYLHRVLKPSILNRLNIKDYGHIVGKNPNISFEGTKIFLQGSPNGPFRGNSFSTGLDLIDLIF
jgi:hypothetical protein